jgi:hypothetical protein
MKNSNDAAMWELLLTHAIDSNDASGTVNLDTIGTTIRSAISLETKLARRDTKEKQTKEKETARRKQRKQAKIEKQKAKPKKMVTRSMVPGLLDKMRLTQKERYYLNTNFGVNRCNTCEKLKDLDCFYSKKTEVVPGWSKYATSCIACFNVTFNNQPLETAFRRLWKITKHNAQERGIEFDITVEHLQKLYELQGGKCNYSGKDIYIVPKRKKENKYEKNTFCTRAYRNFNKASVDRIDSNRGYLIDNVHLVAVHVNMAKLDLLEEDFIQMCQDIVDVAHKRGKPVTAPLLENEAPCAQPSASHLPDPHTPPLCSTEHHNNKEEQLPSDDSPGENGED